MVKGVAVLCCLLALAVQGCRRRDGLVPHEIEREIDVAIQKLGDPNIRRPWQRVTEKIRAISNEEVRVVCRRLRQDKLYAVELCGTDYNQQLRVFEKVWVGLHPDDQVKEAGNPWKIEDECKATVRLFMWMRRELDRWKEMVRDGSAIRLRNKDPGKYGSWRCAYRWCLDLYESQVSLFERRFDFYCALLGATADERARAKALVEAFLGRPMRTKEKLERARHGRIVSDEMQAVQ